VLDIFYAPVVSRAMIRSDYPTCFVFLGWELTDTNFTAS